MASIKGINRSAMAEFSPDSHYLATGTMAGAVDLSFSSSASLEIFNLDFRSDEWELPVVGECPCNERFNRLSWGTVGSDTDEFSLGLIAAGLADGSLHLWNPKKIIDSNDADDALVERIQKHTGPVRGLEFNVNAPNLLASGADDGEIYIWDLVKPAAPTCFPPLKGVGAGAQGEISSLSWNHKVPHILASTSYNGTTVAWDLKRQKPVISFSDSVRRRCSVLQWNPDVATQLIVGSDDDGSPSLRVWDVRNTMSPLKEFVGHSRGVLAMSWCPSDSSFLLTCAKDNRTICWDTATGEGVCELPAGTNWNFDIHWYPKMPGIISASSFDGKIGIYNIEACSRLTAGEGDFGGSLTGSSAVQLRAPNWMKRPAGVSFAFGGKLVTFHPVPSVAGVPSGNSEVFVHNVVTELSLVNRSSEFESAIQNGEKASLRTLCDRKSQDSQSEDDRQTWSFLKVLFEQEGTSRTKLLSHLGFSVPSEENENVDVDLSQEISSLTLDGNTSNEIEVGGKEGTFFPTDNEEDFFNNLQTPKADASPSGDSLIIEDGSPLNGEQMQQELEGLGESSDSSLDEAIQRALVVGDYKEAVLQCIAANRMADALVIAHLGGPSLWERTRDQYLKNSCSSYLKVVSAMVYNDLMNLVKTRPLNSWKETLALLCTFSQGEEWTVLCDTLASRLMAFGNTLAATLCYICAGNIDKTVEIWSQSLKSEHEGKRHVELLQDLMEKTIVLALATGQKRFSASLSKLVENYAELLASQGLLSTAMDCLKLLGSEEPSHELAILRDRIEFSAEERESPKPLHFGSTQLQPVYGSDQSGFATFTDSQQYYYQENPQLQQQQSVPGGPYVEAYQQPFSASYGGGYQPVQPQQQFQDYVNPAAFQPTQSPQIFLPSQAPQIPQTNFAPAPVTTQPIVQPFVPATPPVLKNAEQYQQPSLGTHLYPGGANPVYQVAPPGPVPHVADPSRMAQVPGHKMPPQVMAPAPMPRSFTPVATPGFVPKAAAGTVQPSNPSQPAPVQPVTAPPAPPPTMQTVDTSKVPDDLRPVIATLTRLYNETSEALGGARANPNKKREIEDNSKKIGSLFAKLNSGDISPNAASKLVQLCRALDAGDFAGALHLQVVLTTSDWDECNFWLAALKRMIKTRQNVRLN